LSQVIQVERLVDEQKIGWFSLNLLFWSFLAMFADGYDISAVSFAAPSLVRQWHVAPGAFGPVFAASLVGILFGSPFLGYSGDRFGRKVAIIAGSLLYGLATLAVIEARGLREMEFLRLIAGVGIGGLMPNTIALNAELAPRRRRATLVVLMFTGVTLGSATPGLAAVWLLPRFGWQVLFLIGGVAPIGIAAGLAAALPESIKFLSLHPRRHARLLQAARRLRPDLSIADDAQFVVAETRSAGEDAGPGNGRRRLASIPRALGLARIYRGGFALITPLLWVSFGVALMANYFLNSWMPLLFEGVGLSPRRAAVATTFYHVGGTVGGLLISVLLDRVGFIAIAVLFAFAVPAIAAIGVSSSLFALTWLAAVAGFAVLGAQFGNNAASGLLYPTAFRASGVGWALAIGRFGSILGPLIGGLLIGMHISMQRLFALASAPMLAGTLSALLLARLCFTRFGSLQLDDGSTLVGSVDNLAKR
jgi:AAHS family 4-hydroxybenzoate transporter-like MFS transporter